MEAEVSATLEVCICVLLTTFCTLMLISCIVLVTSSIAEAASTLTLADSVDAAAIWLDPDATPVALSLTFMARSRSPRIICKKAFAIVSRDDRGRTVTFNRPSAIAEETLAISFR